MSEFGASQHGIHEAWVQSPPIAGISFIYSWTLERGSCSWSACCADAPSPPLLWNTQEHDGSLC